MTKAEKIISYLQYFYFKWGAENSPVGLPACWYSYKRTNLIVWYNPAGFVCHTNTIDLLTEKNIKFITGKNISLDNLTTNQKILKIYSYIEKEINNLKNNKVE